ncbi:MAG: squalene/phytoene synthase family protein, partial [Bacteroidales bacterium]|nr:squalene/phytoene synthase family protein [Bacteroidales bacterium]
FHVFAKSMIYDINNTGFDTFDDFIHYAEGASVAPASVFVHLCCLNEELQEYVYPTMNLMDIARPCAIFSYLVHIIRDFQIDQQNNLNYFANDILQKNNLTPDDIKMMSNGTPITTNFRKVIAEYVVQAEHYRLETEKVIENITPFLSQHYLLSLKIIYNLYLQVYNRIDIEKGTFTTQELNPTSEEIKKKVIQISEENTVDSI